MNSKEKLIKALNHEVSPVPVDFGASAVTGIHCSIVAELRDYFGLEKRPVEICDPYQMLGRIEPDLLDALGVDVVSVNSKYSLFGFPMENFKEWKTPWGQLVLVPEMFKTTQNGDDFYIYPEGDLSASPSGHLPGSGYYFDTIIRQAPIDDDHLNPLDNLEEYSGITANDLEYYRVVCTKAAKTGKGVIANFGGTALGDVALVPAPGLKNPKGIRDITEWYMSTIMRQDYVHEVFTKQVDIALENFKKIFKAVGNTPDAVFICGTDFGTQTSQFCSVDTFDTLYMPYYKKINNWIHENTTWKTFKHSCGAVEPFMSHFIEAGFDIINPVQCSATGMDPQHLKNTYGKELVFWGAGADTQKTLPFESPDSVAAEVKRRLEIFSENGGYVFNAIHNIQAHTPLKNIIAMLDTVKTFNSNRI